MFDSLSKSKFHAKCNSLIRTTEKRLEVLRRKKNTVVKFLKNDVADLLNNGLDYDAYCRVEGLIVELNVRACYDFIERFCACITDNLSVINRKNCPEECKEAIQSLICAAARFSELPELRDLRSLLIEIYGTSLEFYAEKEFVKKLKPNAATKEIKFQLMHEIAQEFAIDWSSKCLGQKLFMPQLAQHHTFLEAKERLDKNDDDNVNNVSSSSEDEASSGHIRDSSDRNSSCSSSSSEGSVLEDEEDSQKDVSYSYMPPSCVNANVEKQDSKEVSQKITSNIAAERVSHPDYLSSETKPISVRRRPLKPPMEDGNDGKERTLKPPASRDSERVGSAQSNGTSRRLSVGKVQDGSSDQIDKEKKVLLDGLLMHYCKKVSPYDMNKLKPHQKPPLSLLKGETSSGKNAKSELPVILGGAAYLVEPVTSTRVTKGHAQAPSLLQPQTCTGIVHPNLPDYDDLAARIAAFTGR